MKQLATIFLILFAFAVFGQPKICYIVSYDFVEKEPLPAKRVDAFGRETYQAKLDYRYKTIYQEKSFYKRSEAFGFFEAAKREYDIVNVVIDSMYYKIVLD